MALYAGGTSSSGLNRRAFMLIILMGVAGSGKTTVGQSLASSLGWAFYDADDLHPAQNKWKMAHGIPLGDADRYPWLQSVGQLIATRTAAGMNAIVACSALKRSYRQLITINPATQKIVYLKGDRKLIEARLAKRTGHFMNADLLQSQLDTLEEPDQDEALTVDISGTPDVIVGSIRKELCL